MVGPTDARARKKRARWRERIHRRCKGSFERILACRAALCGHGAFCNGGAGDCGDADVVIWNEVDTDFEAGLHDRREQARQCLGVAGRVVDVLHQRDCHHERARLPAPFRSAEVQTLEEGITEFDHGCGRRRQCTAVTREGVRGGDSRQASNRRSGEEASKSGRNLRRCEHPKLNSTQAQRGPNCAQCVVVGTSCRRLASSAAWTDQASMPGRPAAATMAAGDGPTVETDTLVRASWKHSWSVRRRTARRTAAGLLSGSPMPMKTTLCSLGMPRSAITRWARATCATISSAERLRMRPILPVAQKTQPREQPT
eukprot:scaffold3617_cov119-Isochrysis_galbana.AAC.8